MLSSIRPTSGATARVAALILLTTSLASAEPTDAALPDVPDRFAIPATDEGLPGAGPIRRYDWFQSLWRERRSAWARQVEQDQHAVVFLGDSITQGWGDGLGAAFPGMKVANRGISGDTTRGVLIRLEEDVLALDPAAVVLLIGTNDLEEGADAGGRRRATSSSSSPRSSDTTRGCRSCCARCSRARPRRSGRRTRSRRVNALYRAAVEGDPQVTVPGDLAALRRRRGRRERPTSFPTCCTPTRPATRSGRRPCARSSRRWASLETAAEPFRPRRASRACSTARTSPAGAIAPDLRGGPCERRSAGRPRTRTPPPGRSSTERIGLRRPEGVARRTLRRDRRPARGHDPARGPQDPAAVDDARVPRRLRPEARVPGHPERRQRRLPARPAAAVPRLSPGRALQGAEELPAAGLERARGHGDGRGRPLHLQRRGDRGRAGSPRRPARSASRATAARWSTGASGSRACPGSARTAATAARPSC